MFLTKVDFRRGCLVATNQISHANDSRHTEQIQSRNVYLAQNTSYVYRGDQTQRLISCCMLSEMSLKLQGVAVMRCHLGWRTLLEV